MPRSGSIGYIAPSVAITPSRLHAPPQLTEVERKAFAEIVASVKPGHFQAGDLAILCEFTRSTVLLSDLWTLYRTDDDPKTFATIVAAQKNLFAAARLLRLTPSARAPHHPGPAKYQNQAHTRTAATGTIYDEVEITNDAHG